MPRTAREAPGGIVYQALNRAVARLPLFEKEADYEAFERVMDEALERTPTRILSYCLMPNHWHFVLWPKDDGQLTAFLRWQGEMEAVRGCVRGVPQRWQRTLDVTGRHVIYW